MTTRARLARLAPALVLCLSACGHAGGPGATPASTASPLIPDGSGTLSPAPAALTREQFLARGNCICTATAMRIKSGADAIGPDDAVAFGAYVSGTVLPALNSQIEQLLALGAPPGDEARLSSIYTATENVISALMRDPAPLLKAQHTGPSPFAAVDRRFTAVGLTACTT